MGDLRVTIEHGSGLSSLLNAKTLLVGAAVVVIGGGGAVSRLESGLTDLLYWVAGVMFVAVAVAVYVIIRATRRTRGQTYIRSVHGPTERDAILDERARLRREIALTRAARYQLEVARRMQADVPVDYVQAEVIKP